MIHGKPEKMLLANVLVANAAPYELAESTQLTARRSCHLQESLLLVEGLILGLKILENDLIWRAEVIDIRLLLRGPWELHMTIDPKGADLHCSITGLDKHAVGDCMSSS